jgi:hypothetical protein
VEEAIYIITDNNSIYIYDVKQEYENKQPSRQHKWTAYRSGTKYTNSKKE